MKRNGRHFAPAGAPSLTGCMRAGESEQWTPTEDVPEVPRKLEKAESAGMPSLTRGQIMTWHGELPYAWFHAHSGGMTELPTVSLDYDKADPAYSKPVESEESDKAPEDVKHWTATFTKEQVASACADAGLKVKDIESVEIGEQGQSGGRRP